jgi:hypothetical protein
MCLTILFLRVKNKHAPFVLNHKCHFPDLGIEGSTKKLKDSK